MRKRYNLGYWESGIIWVANCDEHVSFYMNFCSVSIEIKDIDRYNLNIYITTIELW